MERESDPKREAAITLAISILEWEGGVCLPALPEPISVEGLKNSQFPERGGDEIRPGAVSVETQV